MEASPPPSPPAAAPSSPDGASPGGPGAPHSAIEAAVLSGEGQLTARFADGRGCIVLDAPSASYTHIDERGQALVHRLAFALGEHLPYLRPVVDVYNSAVDRPMLCRALEERLHSRAVFQAKATTELRFAHWRATDRTRRRLPNGGLRWASEDGIAQFELPHHRRFFRVTLPVAVPHAADKSRRGASRGAWLSDSRCYMKTVVQTHLTSRCPARWRELLAAACRLPPAGAWSVELPLPAETASHPHPTEPAALQRFAIGVALLPHTIRTSTTPPAMLWTPDAAIHFLPQAEEAEIVMHDGATMHSSHGGSLWTYIFASTTAGSERTEDAARPDGTARLQFATEAAGGMTLRSMGPVASAALAATTALASSFTTAAREVLRTPKPADRPPPAAATTGSIAPGETLVVEVAEGEAAGRYTAFANGGVHIAFEDRTLLTLAARSLHPGRERATLLMPDGTKRSLPLFCAPSAGLGGDGRLGQLLAAAVRFQEWAASTPEQRYQQAMREKARCLVAQAEAAKNARFIALCAPPARDRHP